MNYRGQLIMKGIVNKLVQITHTAANKCKTRARQGQNHRSINCEQSHQRHRLNAPPTKDNLRKEGPLLSLTAPSHAAAGFRQELWLDTNGTTHTRSGTMEDAAVCRTKLCQPPGLWLDT